MITVISKKFPRKGADSPNAPSSVATFSAASPNYNTITVKGINRGSADGVLIVVKLDSVASHKPIPMDGTTYTANMIFTLGDMLSKYYCVYSGNSTSTTITGLESRTTYDVIVFTYNLVDGKPYYNTQIIASTNSKTVITRR